MPSLIPLLQSSTMPVLIGLAALQAVFLLWLWYEHNEIKRLNGRIKRLVESSAGQDLAALLERFHDLGSIKKVLDRLQEKTTDLQVGLEKSVSRVGLIRFNAFPDTGSDLSFALALLSHEGNGFILTSLYARDETRIFIKPVQGGRATHRLSQEEERALAIALGLAVPEKAVS